jgi:hypothetical protein
MAIRRHKEAVQATCTFWKLVVHRHVKFSAMLKSFKVIKRAETQADRMYRMVLERYPASAKLMRCYALFLQEVKNDPWTANKYFRWERLARAGWHEHAPPAHHGWPKACSRSRTPHNSSKRHLPVTMHCGLCWCTRSCVVLAANSRVPVTVDATDKR